MSLQDATTATKTVRQRSLAVIRENQHGSGAFPAAVGYRVYQYCWFRDGAFVADALSRVGDTGRATRFHLWCKQVVDARQERISDLVRRSARGETIPKAEMLPTRYTLDGEEGSEDWWDYQLDGYGTWLWALVEHIQRHELDPGPFLSAVGTLVGYLQAFGGEPCFDWWEESEHHRHLSTLTAVVAGLEAAATILPPAARGIASESAGRLRDVVIGASEPVGYLTKWEGSNAVDGSLLSAAVPFGVIVPGCELAEATYHKIISELLADGVYRYRGDTFYGGGEWIILTAWLGLYEAQTDRLERAFARRDWIVAQAQPNGDLPEQVATNAQSPECIDDWEQRWGPVATPLLWSHAMFLTLDTTLRLHEPQR